jgi:tight adherence protein C
MVLLIVVFLSVFLLIGSVGFLLFYRQAMLQRMAAVVFDRPQKTGLAGSIEKAGESLGVVLEKVEKVVPKSQNEVGVMRQRLIRAGFRDEAAMKYIYASKALVPLAVCMVLSFTSIAKDSPFIFYAAGLVLGYLAPDFWLGRKIKKRQEEIKRTLPDLLDLLVICLEAGLGMDQATTRTAMELASTHPIIADELDLVVLEQRAGRQRSECWRNMAERTDVDVVRQLVSTLVQAEQFGTSIAKTLRTHSDTMRTQRIQEVEERAAKTTIKLIFPLVLFIFPCMFVVTIGPAMIIIQEQFKTLFSK